MSLLTMLGLICLVFLMFGTLALALGMIASQANRRDRGDW